MAQRYVQSGRTFKSYVSLMRNTSSYSISNSGSSLRDRSALVGTSNPYSYANSGRSSPYLAHSTTHSNRTADELESQNDEHLEGLSAKVKLLKDVSQCSSGL